MEEWLCSTSNPGTFLRGVAQAVQSTGVGSVHHQKLYLHGLASMRCYVKGSVSTILHGESDVNPYTYMQGKLMHSRDGGSLGQHQVRGVEGMFPSFWS